MMKNKNSLFVSLTGLDNSSQLSPETIRIFLTRQFAFIAIVTCTIFLTLFLCLSEFILSTVLFGFLLLLGYVLVLNHQKKYNPAMFFIIIPFIIFTFIFSYVPLAGWIIAFIDYRPGIPITESAFVGLKYFKLLFSDGNEMALVLRNTLSLSFLGLAMSPLSMIFAMFLNEIGSSKVKKIVQTFTTLPNFISWILVYSIFITFFSIDDGLVNVVLIKLHIIEEPLRVLSNPDIAWYLQTAIGIWKNLGFGAIIYIAAIAGLDSEIFDASKVDGAGRFKTMWYITLPGIIPTFFVLFLLSISGILNSGFDQYYVFMNPLVMEKLNVLDYYVYNIGITLGEFSFATAVGIFKTLVGIILLFGANVLAKKVRNESIF